MKIGFVSYWLERGAAYVTKQYMGLLEDKYELYVYARGQERAVGDPVWDKDYVTWGTRANDPGSVYWPDFKKWVKKIKPDIIFFNEQRNVESLIKLRREFPNIILGAYIDYYRMDTVDSFSLYDFLICNTKRHYSVFSWHPGCYYVPWGTDVHLFSDRKEENPNGRLRFFHSMGMSTRKGTDVLLKTFLSHASLWENSELIIHTQNGNYPQRINQNELKEKNVTVIEKTVSAPGLYHMGDVYVYPTTLDGLGLTMYEALSCGLPIIVTDEAPMNEVANQENGRLVKVSCYKSREDGYYWPLSYVDEEDLAKQMLYYVDHAGQIKAFQKKAREDAVRRFNWADRKSDVVNIFENVRKRELPEKEMMQFYPHKSLGETIEDAWVHIRLNWLKR